VNILVSAFKREKERGSCFGLYGTSPAQMLGLSFTGLFPAIPASNTKIARTSIAKNELPSLHDLTENLN
jgi:hypothetical protein